MKPCKEIRPHFRNSVELLTVWRYRYMQVICCVRKVHRRRIMPRHLYIVCARTQT